MKGCFKIRAVFCFLCCGVISVQCQERITIFSSSGENEIDYEKPTENSVRSENKTYIGKQSSKPLSVELIKSTKPEHERTIESKTKAVAHGHLVVAYDQHGVRNDSKLSGKRASNTDEKIENNDKKVAILKKNAGSSREEIKESRKLDNVFITNITPSMEAMEKSNKSPGIVCPEKDLPRPLFAPNCQKTNDCLKYGDGDEMLCCDRQCVRGVRPPRIHTQHEPIFFGMIHRKCPSDPLPELSEVKECRTDSDCFPRICCTEALQNGDTANYCRTPEPLWNNLPIPNQVLDPLKTVVAYLQCTPPPPPIFDLFPKSCQNPLDCFPNLCCQERGKRYCRPPKRSLLALVADLGTRLIPEDAAKKFIERISR